MATRIGKATAKGGDAFSASIQFFKSCKSNMALVAPAMADPPSQVSSGTARFCTERRINSMRRRSILHKRNIAYAPIFRLYEGCPAAVEFLCLSIIFEAMRVRSMARHVASECGRICELSWLETE